MQHTSHINTMQHDVVNPTWLQLKLHDSVQASGKTAQLQIQISENVLRGLSFICSANK